MEPKRLDLQSMDIKESQFAKLKELFPEIFTEGNKIDWERLKLTLGEDVDIGKERYGMNWPGKADCFKTIQQTSIATLIPVRNESIDFDNTQNLFIEGDNLEVLKLLQKSYLGKVKMIYIDPPYNTGNDFIYPDNYTETLQTYLEYTGQVDNEGRKFGTNTDTDGRFHSKWMNMMYPRLFLAKNLMREDGVIFISIDDNEVNNLRSLCNEIFGEENFIANIIWQKKYAPQNDAKWFTDNHDHILLYAKNKFSWDIIPLPRTEKQNKYYINDDNDGKGIWRTDNILVKSYTANRVFPITNPNTNKEYNPPQGRCWRYSQESINQMLIENRIYFGKDGKGAPQVKRYLNEVKDGVTPLTVWLREEVGDNQEGKNELNALFDIPTFDTPKVVRLIKRMLQLSTSNSDLVLDFFAGSCTTAHAVIDLNLEDDFKRKYICVQLPEAISIDSEAFKSGFKTISDIGKERIRRVVNKIKTKINEESKKPKQLKIGEEPEQTKVIDIGFKVFKLAISNFKIWDTKVAKKPQAIQEALELHIDHISEKDNQEALLYEILLKSGFELTTGIEKMEIEGKTVFCIAERQLLICLEKELTNELIKAIAELKPVRVVCLDDGFQNNDQLKSNAVQIMKNKGVVKFQTV